VHTHRKTMWGHSEKLAICKLGRKASRPQPVPTLPAPGFWTINIIFKTNRNFVFKLSISLGILFWQPKKINTTISFSNKWGPYLYPQNPTQTWHESCSGWGCVEWN
jgi:hypothetical protein